MKKNLLRISVIAFLALFAGFACNNEDVSYNEPHLEADVDLLEIDNDGGEKSFKLTANRSWSVVVETDEPDTEWLVVDPMKGKGSQDISVTLYPNRGFEREAVVRIKSATANKEIKIVQQGDPNLVPDEELYRIDFGTGAPGSLPYPFLDSWVEEGKDLGVSGSGASTAVVDGSGTSLRASGRLSSGYPKASGGNHIWYRYGGGDEVIINKISLNGMNLIKFSFGVNYYDKDAGADGKSDFEISDLDVLYSVDGSSYDKATYSYDKVGDDWGFAKGEFTLPAGSEFVYFKLTSNATPAGYRFDDFAVAGNSDGEIETGVTAAAATDITETSAKLQATYRLAEGDKATAAGFEYKAEGAGAYTVIEADNVDSPFEAELTGLAKGTKYEHLAYIVVNGSKVYSSALTFTTEGGETPSVEFLYSENVGSKVDKIGTYWPWVAQFDGWTKAGEGQSAVSYSGNYASVRNSGANFEPATKDKVSGAPYVFLGEKEGVDVFFTISDINIAGKSNFTLTFAASSEIGNDKIPTFGTISSAENIQLHGSIDGESWTELPYTAVADSDAGAGWHIATSEFKTKSGATKLYIKFSQGAKHYKLRLDDFTLIKGGEGSTIIDGEETPTKTEVTATSAENVTTTSALIGGSYTLAEGANLTEAGVGYKKEGGEAYTYIKADKVETPFSVALSALEESTAYHYVAYITVDGVKVESSEESFTTLKGGEEIPTEGVLFPGADFEDWDAFLSSLNKFGVKDYAVQKDGEGVEGSKAMYISGTPTGNDYVFTAVNKAEIEGSPTKITFFIRGTSGKSLSINIYRADGKGYDVFNLGANYSGAVLQKANLNNDGNGTNNYIGKLDTAGEWVKVTLDISEVDLSKVVGQNIFALKVGKTAAYDLYIDEISIE